MPPRLCSGAHLLHVIAFASLATIGIFLLGGGGSGGNGGRDGGRRTGGGETLTTSESVTSLLQRKTVKEAAAAAAGQSPAEMPLSMTDLLNDVSGSRVALKHQNVKRVANGGGKLPFRVVHVDLKGAPPRISYLKELFPLISRSGGNAVLMEYEDMFPYEGLVEAASAKNAYTKEQIADLISIAKANNLEVIPLIQTFGHLEHLVSV